MPQTARKGPPPKPPTARILALRHAGQEERLIERKLQNTEIFTLAYQIEQQRQAIANHEAEATDLIKDAIESVISGLPTSAMKSLNKALDHQEAIRGAYAKQKSLLEALEAAEQRDVDGAQRDQGELAMLRREQKDWRIGEVL